MHSSYLSPCFNQPNPLCISSFHLNHINQYCTGLKCASYSVTQVKSQFLEIRLGRIIFKVAKSRFRKSYYHSPFVLCVYLNMTIKQRAMTNIDSGCTFLGSLVYAATNKGNFVFFVLKIETMLFVASQPKEPRLVDFLLLLNTAHNPHPNSNISQIFIQRCLYVL